MWMIVLRTILWKLSKAFPMREFGCCQPEVTAAQLGQEILPLKGEIRLGSRVKIGYYDQEHRTLEQKGTVLDEILYKYDVDLPKARDLLAQVLFFGEDVYKNISDLSGGERARLAMLKILLDEPNFLIMDEPTNHLDIDSKDIVEGLLMDYTGTILVVSHDRYFLDNICTRTLELEKGKVNNYLGNYTYYKEKKAELARIKREKEEAEAAKQKPKQNIKAKQEIKINKSKVKAEIAKLEEEIAEKEQMLEELSLALSDGSNYQDEDMGKRLVQDYKKLEEEIPQLYEKWEELNLLLEG